MSKFSSSLLIFSLFLVFAVSIFASSPPNNESDNAASELPSFPYEIATGPFDHLLHGNTAPGRYSLTSGASARRIVGSIPTDSSSSRVMIADLLDSSLSPSSSFISPQFHTFSTYFTEEELFDRVEVEVEEVEGPVNPRRRRRHNLSNDYSDSDESHHDHDHDDSKRKPKVPRRESVRNVGNYF